MNLRQLIQADPGWLDAPTPGRVLWVSLAACAGLAIYGFTVGFWRDPVMGGYVAVILPLLVVVLILLIPIARAIQSNHQATPQP